MFEENTVVSLARAFSLCKLKYELQMDGGGADAVLGCIPSTGVIFCSKICTILNIYCRKNTFGV